MSVAPTTHPPPQGVWSLPQPWLPADDITNNVRVTNEDFVAVPFLLDIGSVDVVSESGLNASAIFVILLKAKVG